MNIGKIIKEIQYSSCFEDDIIKYLDIKNNFVLSNAMKAIVKRQCSTDKVVKKLKEISQYRQRKHTLIGIYTVGHLAIATLIRLGVNKEDLDIYIKLDNFDKNIVDKLSKGYDYVT